MVDTLDLSLEESGKISEFSDRELEAIDAQIRDNEEQEAVNVKVLAALDKVTKEKR